MPEIRLQYSVVCEKDQGYSFNNILHGFQPGEARSFYVINKWIRNEPVNPEQNRGLTTGKSDSEKKTIFPGLKEIKNFNKRINIFKKEEEGYFQVTDIIADNAALARSRSGIFNLRLSHTHHNHFQNITFKQGVNYRIRVTLFDREGHPVEQGSLEYPLFISPA